MESKPEILIALRVSLDLVYKYTTIHIYYCVCAYKCTRCVCSCDVYTHIRIIKRR